MHKKLLTKLIDYNSFIGERYVSAFTFCHVHGYWESEDVIKKGKTMRVELEQLGQSIGLAKGTFDEKVGN